MFDIGLGVTLIGVVILLIFAIFIGLKEKEVRLLLPLMFGFTAFGISLMVTSFF